MADRNYLEVYNKLPDTAKYAMCDLYMSGINHDGHTWVTYGDVEKAVGIIVKDFLENKNDRNTKQNNL